MRKLESREDAWVWIGVIYVDKTHFPDHEDLAAEPKPTSSGLDSTGESELFIVGSVFA